MNKKNKAKLSALVLASVLGTSLGGCACNYQLVDTKYQFNKAIIHTEEDKVLVVEIAKWTDYDGEQLQIITKDGMVIVTSSFDTKLINDSNSRTSVEELVESMYGEDCSIAYYGENGPKLSMN